MIPSTDYDKEKVAIITGASQGIGTGLTTAYLELGYAVIAGSPGLDARPH
jgi:NAD(P)-dependent dehydrogenase (short-subunit alcohol dehydrogenase family)